MNISRIDSLNKENYDTWKMQMEALLTKNDAWQYVNGVCMKPKEKEGNTKEIEEWMKGDSKAKSDLILSISPSELKQVKHCLTSRDVWLKLESMYQSKGPARKATLLKNLTLQKMEENGNVIEHLNKFFDAVDKLGDMEVTIHTDLLSIMLLYSLPSKYENFRCAIESRDDLPPPETLRIKILEESEARKSSVRNDDTQNALATSKKYYQGRYQKPTSRNKNFNEKSSSNVFRFKCHKCHKVGHKASECKRSQGIFQSENVSLCGWTGSHEEMVKEYKWCIDSGASSHLSKDISDFISFNDCPVQKLNLANKESIDIVARGTSAFTGNVFGETRNFTLNDTLYVPDLRSNLMSVSKMTNKGFEVLFKKDYAVVLDKEGDVKLSAERVGDLYFACRHDSNNTNLLQINPNAASSAYCDDGSVELWHRRLGHVNYTDLVKAIENQAIICPKVKIVKKTFNCDICCQNKMSRSPFPKFSDRRHELSNILDIIHTDLCGPMRVESNGKAKYYVEFIDDASRWCEVMFIKHKSDVLEKAKEVFIRFMNQKGKKIKCIQSDNGTEYINNEFNYFLKMQGITRRISIPYNPEQNGVAERKNRTLLDMARCLLADSGLPPSFWAEAVNTANYLRNRCPTKSLEGRTPFEVWTGKKPNVSHLKVFGSRVYCLDRKPNKGKFEPRGKEGIFVGYSEESKGYRVWLTKERKVEITRDIKFLEKTEKCENKPTEVKINDYSTLLEDDRYKNLPNPQIDIRLEAPQENSNSEENKEEYTLPVEAVQETHQEESIQGENNSTIEVRECRRGPGRPKVFRTGAVGRPRKIHKIVNHADLCMTNEFSFTGEVSMKQATSGPEADEWYMAMAEEIKSILRNNTWVLVDRPHNHQVIGSRMILRNKFMADGTFDKKKARLVAQGFNQIPGVHFNETFAPVARIGTVRMVASLAAQFDMYLQQLDVTTAYLNGKLSETIYMEPPNKFVEMLQMIIRNEEPASELHVKAENMLREFNEGNKICLLKRSLYGLKQAGRSWNSTLDKAIKESGALPSASDPCLYKIHNGKDLALIVIYVDDILIASKSQVVISNLKRQLKRHFDIKDIGEVKFCLGIEFNRSKDTITMRQRGYVKDLLDRFGMKDCKPISTPMDSSTKLSKSETITLDEDRKLPYRELIGGLTYLSVSTRPDISYCVSYLGQFNNCYDKSHWSAAKRVLRYLKGTLDLGLVYKKVNSSQLTLQGYVDADWGSCPVDRRSFTGHVFMLNNNLICWDSRKQKTVALSTTEAEYMGFSDVAKEAIYLRRFLKELDFDVENATVFSDNMGAIKLSENPTYHARSKHIDIRYHFIREAMKNKDVTLKYISSEEMAADVFTKALPRTKHNVSIMQLGLGNGELDSRGSVRN